MLIVIDKIGVALAIKDLANYTRMDLKTNRCWLQCQGEGSIAANFRTPTRPVHVHRSSKSATVCTTGQFIGVVHKLKIVPYLCYSNGVSVEGATHKQVVDLIRSGGNCLKLVG